MGIILTPAEAHRCAEAGAKIHESLWLLLRIFRMRRYGSD